MPNQNQKPPAGKRVVRGGSVVAEYGRETGRRASSAQASGRRTVSDGRTVSGGRTAAGRRPVSSRNGAYAARRRPPRKKKMKGWQKALLSAAIVLAVLVGLCVFLFQYYFGGLNIKPIGEDADLGISSAIERDDSITNILLCGMDTRDRTEVSGRSDALMMLTLDNKHDKIKIVSIPRDTLVTIYMGEGETNPWRTKINHAYAYGGPELAIKTFNQTFHTDIKDYVSVNFFQLADIIDAVGGVDIEVSRAEMENLNELVVQITGDASNQLDYSQAGGLIHLNGSQAVAFSRIRYVGTDDARTERQREVLAELFKAALEMDYSQYPEFARKLLPMCETSLTLTDILDLAPIMLAEDLDLEMTAFPNEYIDISQSGTNTVLQDGVWYYVYDTEQAADMIHKFVYDDLTFDEQYAPANQDTSSELSSEPAA